MNTTDRPATVRPKWTINAAGQWVQQLFERDERGDRNILAAPLNLNKETADAAPHSR